MLDYINLFEFINETREYSSYPVNYLDYIEFYKKAEQMLGTNENLYDILEAFRAYIEKYDLRIDSATHAVITEQIRCLCLGGISKDGYNNILLLCAFNDKYNSTRKTEVEKLLKEILNDKE